MINIIIADDDTLVREIIRTRLKNANDINIVASAVNGMEAYELCKKHKADIVLMDVRMPVLDGLEATRLIKEYDSNIKVLVLTSFIDQEYIQKAMENKCNGYITKDSEEEVFISVIRNVYKGYDVWGGGLLNKAGSVKVRNIEMNQEELKKLTERELDVVKCVTCGMKDDEIARVLYIAPGYVRNIISTINQKLGFRNSKELAVWGARQGL